MTWTERKYCNKCQRNTIHLKENEAEELEEECLYCDWKTLEEYWQGKIEEDGFETAKDNWIEIRDSQLNQEIWKEMDTEEKFWWGDAKKKVDTLFALHKPQEKEENPSNSSFKEYLPYILGGVGIFALIILIIVLATNNRRR